MPDAENPKQVNNNDLRNAQFAGGLVNADNVIAGQIGGDNYNIYIGQPSQQKIDIDWHQVSSSLLDEHLRLTSNPLTLSEGISYRTEQVYVPLGLVERKKQPRQKDDVPPEKGSELYHETEITQTFQHQQFLEQVLRDRQSPKSQGKRIAIIGEPGAGKTTLLQQIAQWISKQIEQSVVIWVSLGDLRSRDLESYLLEVWLQAVARTAGQAEASTQVKDDFVAQFNQGLVWLVLDGVDEMQVTDGDPLEEIGQQIRQGGLLQQSRIVLSCRLNLWDGGSNALNSFDNYRTLEFSYPQQVEEFICKWFGSQSPAEMQTGQQLCVALKEPGKERIRDLVKNPLRLTLLCLNWRSGEGNLPQTKAGLYEQFVSYFYEWKKEQFATTREQRRQLNVALAEMAREAIDKEATRFWLRQDFVCEYLGEPDDADSLFAMALRLGWLNKVGLEVENPRKAVYAFFHPTFQEYFAALAISDWHYFLNHIIENPTHPNAKYRIFEAEWKEVTLLWLGREDVSFEEKKAFIKALIGFNDGSTGFYDLQAYFLAGVGIAEFESNYLADEIIEQLIAWVFSSSVFFKNHSHPSIFVNSIAKDILIKTHNQKVVDALVRQLTSNKSQGDCLETALILLEKFPGHELAIKIIINYLNKSLTISKKTKSINLKRIQVINKLEKFSADNNLANITLSKIPKNTPNYDQNYSKYDFSWLLPKINSNDIVKFLDIIDHIDNIELTINQLNEVDLLLKLLGTKTKLNPANKELEIINELIDISNRVDDSKSSVISGLLSIINLAALNRLAEIAANDSNILNSLIEKLYKIDDRHIRQKVAMALGKAACLNINATKSVLHILKTTEDEIIADTFIFFLKTISNSNLLTLVVTELKDYIEDIEGYEIIWHCAKNMAYPNFYLAWHEENGEKSSLKHFGLPQHLQVAINNNSQLSQKIHLIRIDTSKFIDPDNPASKIYTAIVKAGYPKCPNGTPKTMVELQTYWDLLETDKQVVLLFYSGATNTTDGASYSDTFLSTISRFEGKICFISEPMPSYNTLQVFAPHQSVDEILEWLRCS